MLALAFSDIHRDLEAVAGLAHRSEHVDLLIGAGDFATKREGLEPVIDAIAAINKPAVLVHGNGESEDELRDACRGHDHLHVLHGAKLELGGRVFYGLGGAVPPTPFGPWSVDLTEEQAEERLLDCPTGAVLITHSPPHGHCDGGGDLRGSRAIARCVAHARPTHVLCGHIHQAWGETSTLGPSRIINLGPTGETIEL